MGAQADEATKTDGTDGADEATKTDGTALDRLLAERGDQLMRAAVALAGSRIDGEDLLQAALERLLRSRHRIESDLEGYLRRILYNLAADGWRRRATGERRLRLIRQAPNPAAETGPAGAVVELRDALVRLLAQLPPRQRTVIVLRFWAQLSEAETAAMLGCSEGAIKSAASRGMARLRELAGRWQDDPGQPPGSGRFPERADRHPLTGQMVEEPR